MAKNVLINVNYYIAKYDYEIGNKIKPNSEPRDLQAILMFKRNCILEILSICSYELTNDTKNY